MFVSVVLSGFFSPFERGSQKVSFIKEARGGLLFSNNRKYKVFFEASLNLKRGFYLFLTEPVERTIYDREEVIFVSKRVFLLGSRGNCSLIEGIGKVKRETSEGVIIEAGKVEWEFESSLFLKEGSLVKFRGELLSPKKGKLYWAETDA